MSDKTNEPMGTCDWPKAGKHTRGSHLRCSGWKPLPTTPVDARPAKKPCPYCGGESQGCGCPCHAQKAAPAAPPAELCPTHNLLLNPGGDCPMGETPAAPAAPPQDVSEAELRSLFQDVIDEGCHCDVQVGFSCGIHSKVERLRFALTLAAERPTPDDPRYVAGTCPTCGAQPAPAPNETMAPASERANVPDPVKEGIESGSAQELGQHGRLLSDTESRAYVEQNADAALATPAPPAIRNVCVVCGEELGEMDNPAHDKCRREFDKAVENGKREVALQEEDLERARVEKSHSLQLIESAAARLRESLANTEDYPIGRVYPIVATDAEIILSQLPYLINEHRILGDLLKKAYEQCAFEYNESQRFRRAAQAERQVAGALCRDCLAGIEIEDGVHVIERISGEIFHYRACLAPATLPAERVSAEELAKVLKEVSAYLEERVEKLERPTHTPESGEGTSGQGK